MERNDIIVTAIVVCGLSFLAFNMSSCVAERDKNERDIKKACIERGSSLVNDQCFAGQIPDKRL